MDDSQLLREYVEHGSHDAFAQLVNRYIGIVYWAARRQMGESHAAEDVVQAAFIALAANAGRIRRGEVLSAWLLAVTRKIAAMALRGEARRKRHERELAGLVATMNNPADEQNWRQIAPQLDEAIGQLGERNRTALILRYFEGLSAEQVAERLGISPEAARQRVCRGLEQLRCILDRRGVTVTSVGLAALILTNAAQPAPAGVAAATVAAATSAGAATSAAGVLAMKGAAAIMAASKAKAASILVALILLSGMAVYSVIELTKSEPGTVESEPQPIEPVSTAVVETAVVDKSEIFARILAESPLPASPAGAASTVNRVLVVDGKTSYMRVPDSASLHTFTNAITIEAWFKPFSFYRVDGFVNSIARKDILQGRENFYLRFNIFNGPVFELNPGGNAGTLRARSGFKANTWYHLAGVYDGTRLSLLVNGQLAGAQDGTGAMEIDATDLFIGMGDLQWRGGEFLHGALDEIRIWNIARTPADIRATMNSSLTGRESGLVAYWNFDDGTARDVTAHGNHGRLNSSARIAESAKPAVAAPEAIAATPAPRAPDLGTGMQQLMRMIARTHSELSFQDVSVVSTPDVTQPQDARMLAVLGCQHMKLGLYSDAIEWFQRGERLAAGNPDPAWAYALACAYSQRGDTREALAELRRAVSLGFNDLDTMRKDTDLDILRQDQSFQELIAQIEARRAPTARK